jgi:N-methylhydantoinase A
VIRLGVDIGGTFTDFVGLDSETGRAVVWKRLTTPEDPSRSVVDGIEELLQREGWAPDAVSLVLHGTTLIANALIERKGARIGVLATQGHRDALQIGRELRYDVYDLFLERPAPLAKRSLRLEVAERLGADGSELRPLDCASVEQAADRLRESRVEAVAVSLLHSYLDPSHEERVATVLREHLPGIPISLSSRIAPVMHEYERASTTAANAYVQPLMSAYLERLREGFGRLVPKARFYVMLSSGGLATAEQAVQFPIQLVESGPAAGALAAVRYAAGSGYHDLLAFDMGGTTAKLCVVAGGVPDRAQETEVARRARFKRGSGIPLLVPTIELIEIGAGGGSIARRDRLGLLKVGPDSAGADPGPACYSRGGASPTVTDANVLLGFLDPASFLGGRMTLDAGAAEAALTGLGDELGMNALETAQGVHDLVNEGMAIAARRHVTERARDPRRHALVAFGGSGPVHAYGLAGRLKIKTVICPPAAGAASALGCLCAPATVELARSRLTRLDQVDWAELERLFEDMETEARRLLVEAAVDPDQIEITSSADVRYAGQGFEVPVAVPPRFLGGRDAGALEAAFGDEYQARYSRRLDGLPAEVITWRLSAQGPRGEVDIAGLAAAGEAETSLKGSRPAHFPEAGGFVDCAVYDRYSLRPGTRIEGPAIVEERESTAVIGPLAFALVDAEHNLVMTIKGVDQ